MNKKVLIVEDESIVAMEIARYVKSLGYETVGTVSNADDAYAAAKESVPDVILMDVHLKGAEDGISAAERISREVKSAIVYITAFNDDASIERAVATDPSAYLTKPFNRSELAAALKIAIRSAKKQSAPELPGVTLQIDDEFSYDAMNRQLICCGEFVHLTRKELELLDLLINARGRIVDLYTVENRIWPDKSSNENTRRGLVARLRSKLKYQFIETISGQGYRMRY